MNDVVPFNPHSFPGLEPEDDVLGLLKVMTSKHPDDYISAKIALAGEYDPCKPNNVKQNRTKREDTSNCEKGIQHML